MIIEFVDKTGRTITISCSGGEGRAGEIVMALLATLPDSEFIMRPVIKSR